jgi:hypothetical protein
MTDRTAAARNARLREKKRAEGLVPVTVMVPESCREDLKAIAAKMREDNQHQRWLRDDRNAAEDEDRCAGTLY